MAAPSKGEERPGGAGSTGPTARRPCRPSSAAPTGGPPFLCWAVGARRRVCLSRTGPRSCVICPFLSLRVDQFHWLWRHSTGWTEGHQRLRHPPWPGAVTVERAVSPHLPSPPWFPESSSTVSFPDTRGTASLGASALWEQKGPRGPAVPLSRCSPCRGSPCPGSPTGPGRAAWRCCATGELGAPSP